MMRPNSGSLGFLAVLVLSCSTQLVQAEVTLIEGGQPRAAIFVPARVWDDAAKKPEEGVGSLSPESQRRRLRESVRDLAEILQRISGAKVDVVAGPPAAGEKRVPILIGEFALEKFGNPQKSDPYGQGLRIVVKDNTVGLYGESDLGASYGIYTFLDRLGCRWYMPSPQGEVLPKLTTLTLKDQDFSDAPFTVYRGIWYCGTEYARRNRMGGMLLNAGHALEYTVPKELRKTNPEIRAIIKGKPHEHLVKWTHPLVAKAISDSCLAALAKDPTIGSFSLSPDDGMGWDESDDAKHDAGDFDAAAGAVSKTDRLMVLANRVAETVTAKYPHVKFGILAYVDYTRPPVKTKVHPAVIPQIAPIAFTRGHPMNDPHEPNNKVLRELVEGWAKVVPATSYYFYGYNLAETATPNPMLTKWGHDVPYVLEKGKCLFWQPETSANFESCLHALYMSNRLAWNKDEKPAAIYDELHQKFYGAAAKPMAAYWQKIDDMWVQTPEYSGCGFGHLRRFTPERLAVARKLLDEGRAAARTEVEKFRIEMAHQSFTELELFMKLRRDLAAGKFINLADEALKYTKVMDALGQQYKPQSAFTFLGWTGEHTLSSRYFDQFYKQTYDDATRIARQFQILTSSPLRVWKYQVDKEVAGEAKGWSRPEFDDVAWKTTDCALDTWSTLGIHNYMGSLWYRGKVSLKSIPSGKKVSLWIGGTDGRVKVFVNGQAIPYTNAKGEKEPSFTGYCQPASFDITSAIKGNGVENQISLFCSREFLNEAGTGGLIAPVVIYCEK